MYSCQTITVSGVYIDIWSWLDYVFLSSELPEESDPTANDLLMAQMLQMEFDKEADKVLKREQDHYNGNSKVCQHLCLSSCCYTFF